MALVGLGGLPLCSALYSLGSMTLGTVLNGLDSYFRSAFNSWRLAARLGVDGYGGLLMGSVLNVPGSLPLGSALSGSLPLGMALGGLNRLPLGTARKRPARRSAWRYGGCISARRLMAPAISHFARYPSTFGSLPLDSALGGRGSCRSARRSTATAACRSALSSIA